MKNKTFFLLSFAGLILFAGFFYAQPQIMPKISLETVKVNGEEISQGSWNNISVQKKDSLTFVLTPPEDPNTNVLYKVFLNGNIIDPGRNLTKNTFTVNDLDDGAYIIKFTGFTLDGWESSPVVLQFEVVSNKPAVEKKAEVIAPETKTDSIPLYIYILAGLCVLQFIVIIIILAGKKNKKVYVEETIEAPVVEQKRISKPVVENDVVEVKETRGETRDGYEAYAEVVDPDEELKDLEYTNKRMKEELKNQREEIKFLRKQIDELESNVNNLEKSNVHLLEQKEKLSQSKLHLEELQNQKEEVFAIAVHDIKNPAAAIKSCIDLLTSYDLNAVEQNEIMTAIITSSEDIVKLSQQMCLLIANSKPEVGVTLKMEKGAIKSVIDDICMHNMSYAKAKKVKLINKSSVGLPEITFDQAKMEELIDNLINNAIKFAPPNTIVEIKTFVQSKILTVEISDNGVGMSEEDVSKVFQKGAVLSSRPTGKEQQSGLGLWICKKIVEDHNGKIWVKSKLGAGSTFAFELPIR